MRNVTAGASAGDDEALVTQVVKPLRCGKSAVAVIAPRVRRQVPCDLCLGFPKPEKNEEGPGLTRCKEAAPSLPGMIDTRKALQVKLIGILLIGLATLAALIL